MKEKEYLEELLDLTETPVVATYEKGKYVDSIRQIYIKLLLHQCSLLKCELFQIFTWPLNFKILKIQHCIMMKLLLWWQESRFHSDYCWKQDLCSGLIWWRYRLIKKVIWSYQRMPGKNRWQSCANYKIWWASKIVVEY